jgi:flagellar hook-associated protein 3 FlgL
MSFNYISTLMLSSPLRSSIVGGESALAKASKEATTGRFADVGLDLGPTTGRDVALRADLSFADQLVDTNALVAGRLEVTQNKMGDVISTAQDFLKQMIAARDSDNGAQIIQPTAAANLQDLIGGLNSSYNGSSVFGGLNTQTPPVKNYAPLSTSKAAIATAFSTFFGFSQGSPLESTITPAQMTTFLNTRLDAEFVSTPPPGPPGPWNTNWSNATDQVLSNRISTTEIVNTSVSANDPNFRSLAEAYTALSDLGTGTSKSTFQVVVDKAIGLVTSAINGLSLVGGAVGTTQQRISNSSNRLQTQRDLLNKQIVGMEAVDPAQSSARVNSLQTQIQTALSLTAQLQKISLLNYL